MIEQGNIEAINLIEIISTKKLNNSCQSFPIIRPFILHYI